MSTPTGRLRLVHVVEDRVQVPQQAGRAHKRSE